jgi:hypothetical protein
MCQEEAGPAVGCGSRTGGDVRVGSVKGLPDSDRSSETKITRASESKTVKRRRRCGNERPWRMQRRGAGRRKRAMSERRRPEELRYRAGGAGEKGILGTAGFPPVAAPGEW